MQSGQPNRLHTIDHYSLRPAQLHLKPMAWQRWALQIADNFGLLKTGLQNVAKIQDFRCFYCPNGCGRSATILVSFVTVSSPPSRQSSAALSPVTPQVQLSPRCLTSQASSHSHPANNFWYESCPCSACGCTPRSILRIFDTVFFLWRTQFALPEHPCFEGSAKLATLLRSLVLELKSCATQYRKLRIL